MRICVTSFNFGRFLLGWSYSTWPIDHVDHIFSGYKESRLITWTIWTPWTTFIKKIDTEFALLTLSLWNFFVCTFCMCYFLHLFGRWSIRQKKETLPKAKRPESWVQLKKVTWLSHITSSNTNLNQILESLLSTISTKHQHLAET